MEEAKEKGWMPVRPRTQAARLGDRGQQRAAPLEPAPAHARAPVARPRAGGRREPEAHGFTGLHADYLLPAAGYYEKPGIKYSVAYVPYLHYCDAAVKPVGEAKDEWEIYWRLAQEVRADRARAGHPEAASGCGCEEIDLQEHRDAASRSTACTAPTTRSRGERRRILEESPAAEGMTVEGLKQTGIAKYASVGGQGIQENLFNSELEGEGVMQALTDMTEQRWRWPTLTGRQQCYIDHAWFLEARRGAGRHVESPKAGGDHPFQLDLVPLALEHPQRLARHADAAAPAAGRAGGLPEPDRRRGARHRPTATGPCSPTTTARSACAPSTRPWCGPKVAYYFHAWEPHQFPDHKSYKFLIPGLMKPLHFRRRRGTARLVLRPLRARHTRAGHARVSERARRAPTHAERGRILAMSRRSGPTRASRSDSSPWCST